MTFRLPTESELDRAISAKSFAGFARAAWHVLEPSSELKWGWALDAICEHLEAVSSGEIKRLLMNVPPGSMKSLLTGVLFPAWEWGPQGKQSKRFLGTAHKQDLAVRDNLKCRRLITSEWFQERWPVILTGDQNAKTKFENDQTGFREAMAFTSMTGSRGDCLILDDPLSVDDAKSLAALYAAELTFTESLPTRVNNENSAIVVIMQRLHDKDTSGIILARDLGYTHLCLPMRFEVERRCVTSIGFVDPRVKDGDLMFPERFSEKQVRELEKTLGSYATAGQLQQRPVPREGGMFKRPWFNVVSAVPAGTIFVRGWDFASTQAGGDYTAGAKVGITPSGRFIIADVIRDQVSPAGVERMLVNTAAQDGTTVSISIPQDPGQAGKSQAAYFVSKLAGYSVKATPETGRKEVRAEPLAAQAEAGNVDILVGEWNDSLLDEISLFPNGKHDDQVDAVSRAFDSLLNGRVGAGLLDFMKSQSQTAQASLPEWARTG
jgi:predicted phage terminase large subunit-like protein